MGRRRMLWASVCPISIRGALGSNYFSLILLLFGQSHVSPYSLHVSLLQSISN